MKENRAVFAMLAVSVLINVVLAHKLRQFNEFFGTKAEQLLQPGTMVHSFEAVDLKGQIQTVAYNKESKPVVLYIFTPPCSWCARNLDNFKTLVQKKSGEYRFIGLSLSEEGLSQYVANNDLKLPVYSRLLPQTRAAYKLGGTPQTIVVSPEGRVLENWPGAYVGGQKTQVEAFFHLMLPGIRPAAESGKARGSE